MKKKAESGNNIDIAGHTDESSGSGEVRIKKVLKFSFSAFILIIIDINLPTVFQPASTDFFKAERRFR